MPNPRQSVREARKTISATLRKGKTVAIGDDYKLRGFIVGIPPHNYWDAAERKKAIKAARAAFFEAWAAEIEQ